MPKGFDDLTYLLATSCEEKNNFVLATSIKTRAAQVIEEALIHRGICIFSLSKSLIVAKDLAFTEVTQLILRATKCELKIISPFNPGYLITERQIQTIGKMITKHLIGIGEM